jgi:long-chain acyl-CoA synthetase
MITADPTQPSSIEGVMTLGMLLKDQSPAFDTVATSSEDTAVILYTSGTTGQPKGAELSHSNMACNAMISQLLMKGSETDTTLITLPLFHSFAQTVLMNVSVFMAAKMVLIPRFDPAAVLSAFEQHKVTVFAGVPTMYIGLLNYPSADDYDLAAIATNLRLGVSGGASLPVEVLRQFQEKFDVTILEGYGLSETSPVATFNYLEGDLIPGSIGQPAQGVEARVMDADGNLLGPDEDGEIVIRGHNIMKGYYRKPEATAEAMRGGWFHTGDIGKQDARGNFYIVDRLKDMILRGGYNVYPREIEEVLMQHESIAMVAVIGVPHETHGEEIKAYVVPKPGVEIDADELKAWTKERIADYKYPREIEFREQLPMTATGKILKKELKAELRA